jgi:apolipoprotein N-acyltransferase
MERTIILNRPKLPIQKVLGIALISFIAALIFVLVLVLASSGNTSALLGLVVGMLATIVMLIGYKLYHS